MRSGLAFIVFAAVGTAGLARAPSKTIEQQESRCVGEARGVSAADRLTACTIAIQSNSLPTLRLSKVYRSRASLLFDQALAIGGSNHEAINRALPKSVLADYNEALRLNPKDPDTLVGRGMVELAARNFAAAKADFVAALRLLPNSAGLWLALGMVKTEDGKLDEAIAALDHALQIDPKCAPALSLRGRDKRAQGRIADADADEQRAAALPDICAG